jgi:hypothetical protein
LEQQEITNQVQKNHRWQIRDVRESWAIGSGKMKDLAGLLKWQSHCG